MRFSIEFKPMSLFEKTGTLLKKIRISERSRTLRDCFTLKATQVRSPMMDGPTILVEGVEDPYYYMLFGTICEGLQSRKRRRVEIHMFATLRIGMADSASDLLPSLFP